MKNGLEEVNNLKWCKVMDSWILSGKNSEKDLLENFILNCTFWETVEEKSLKTLAIERECAIKFPLWMIHVGESLLLLLFIDIIDLILYDCSPCIIYTWKKEYSLSLWISVNLELSKAFDDILILV